MLWNISETSQFLMMFLMLISSCRKETEKLESLLIRLTRSRTGIRSEPGVIQKTCNLQTSVPIELSAAGMNRGTTYPTLP